VLAIRRLSGLLVFCALFLAACDSSKPNSTQIKEYIENYQVVNKLNVADMDYKVTPSKDGDQGTIQVSGQLELAESLYKEDKGSQIFRKNVNEVLRRNRFSEREIKHDIYQRVIQASTRVPNDESNYFTFLKLEHEAGLKINFSADLSYQKVADHFKLDGPVRLAQLLGARANEFSNPVLDDSELVKTAVENVLMEQTRYRELMEQSRTLLTRLWDNDFGLLLWNRKVPYLGNENLTKEELSQLSEFKDWRGVYHISNIKPIEYRTPHASNFFELGSYTTDGIATCLRQTGFANELTFLKSQFEQYCEFGKQYPVTIQLSSMLNEVNQFVAKAEFIVNGVSSGELAYGSKGFGKEQNELARYSDQQQLVILNESFDLAQHNQPVFSAVAARGGQAEHLRLQYTGKSNYAQLHSNIDKVSDVVANNVEPITEPELIVDSDSVINNYVETNVGDPTLDQTAQASQELEAAADAEIAEQEAKAAAEKELVKSIQLELKRLGLYESSIDGLAGRYTYWAIDQAQQQLNTADIKAISPEFLAILNATSTDSITQPEQPYQPVSTATTVASEESEPQTKKKGTLAGQAFRWFGRQFSKKKDQSETELEDEE